MKKPNRIKVLQNNIPQSIKIEGYSFGDIDIDWIYGAMEQYANEVYKHRIKKFNLKQTK